MNLTSHMKVENLKIKRHPSCKFTMARELGMVNRYQEGETFREMEQDYGSDRSVLWNIVTNEYHVDSYQTSGYPKRYDLDVNSFEEVNERSAYALGLIASDGHITEKTGDLQLYSMDKENTENLLDCMKCTKNIKEIEAGERSNKSKGYYINLAHEKLIGDITNYIPKRSKDLTKIPPQIENSNHLNHYIRGILDGDGSVSKKGYITFTGTKPHMLDLKRSINEKYGIKANHVRDVMNSPNSYHLSYTANNTWKELYNVLYDKAKHFLTRKKERFGKRLGDN